MNTSHHYSKAYLNTLRRMSRPASSEQATRNTSMINNQYDTEPAKPQQQNQENTIKNFLDSQEHELMSTGYNMNGSRVYLASSHNFKFESPERNRNTTFRQSASRKPSNSNMRCNTVGVDALEANKGFHCVNYRSRERYTDVGGARKRALSSASVAQGNQLSKSQDRMNQTNSSFSPVKQSTYQTILYKPQRQSTQEDRLLSEIKMSGSRIFKQQTTQFRRKPLKEGQNEPVWDLHDEEMAQRLKELSDPKKILQREFPRCAIGGDKTMDLQDPQSQEFIQRLSAPKKYIPWPTATQGAKIFKCNNNDQMEYLNKISLPRRMADHGHRNNFRYNFCNCNNGDDYADEGRNMQGSQSSNAYFKIQSFFYQNSKAQDDCLFYPKTLN